MKRLLFVAFACLLVSQPSKSAASEPPAIVISEFLALNVTNGFPAIIGSGLRDDFGEFSDWIEIRNVTLTNVNLSNWGLTDNRGDATPWRFPSTNLSAGGYMVVFATARNRSVAGAALHTDFRLSGDGEYLGLIDPEGVVATEFAPTYPTQVPNVSYGFGVLASNLTFVATNADARLRVPANDSDGTNWTFAAYDDSAWTAASNGVGFGVVPGLRTDIGAAMSNVNASAYLRLPFIVADPDNIVQLTLRVRYDDGIVAWVNGVEVHRANAPDPLSFNSAATAVHSSTNFEEIRMGVFPGFLKADGNILAIQGLNRTAADSDFLVQAELIGLTALAESSTPGYFFVPTPRLPNTGATTNLGPSIAEVRHTPNVPLDHEDLVLTTRVTPTFNAVTNVTLRYRIMFGVTNSTLMFDDGLHGDGAASDGVYGATISSTLSTNGQMIRFFVQATDSQGASSRWPLFTSQAETAEYLGTIVDPTNVVSKLPIVHLFAPPTILDPGPITEPKLPADTQQGAKISLFYDGELYDNISMQLRGNTTANYNKKSHRIEFNREHLFRHSEPGPRIRKTSFVADYPDPTYMRQGLAFWLCDLIGSPASFYAPYRLQLNGQFYQLANHNDVHGEELLERLGYNPNGALYNAAGQVTRAKASTGGFEKKTRKWENDADYTNLVDGIVETLPLAARGTNFFENFDVPNAINYLVTGRWTHENDNVWANMSLYHDNDGDNQWRIVSFDMNLSWGAIYYEGSVPSVIEGVQATNDIHKAHPLYGSQVTPALNSGNFNRVYDTVFRVPQLREMFLRRLRTVMDTYVQPPGTPSQDLIFEKKVRDWQALIAEEAERDRNYWGWPGKGGQCNFDPGIRLGPGVDAMISEFIVKRRLHFFVKHCVTNASPAFPVGITKTNNAGIPLSQPSDAQVFITAVEYNPASSNQAQEYICVTNPNPYAVDISGWTLGGGVDFTFHLGTVMASNSIMYVSPNVRAFRARTVSPRGGQGHFVVGPYKGQLSARGETLYIVDDTGRGVSTNTYAGNPSLAQQYLRITEIMYNPVPLTGNTNDAQAFEYIELRNISTDNTTLDLTNVRFVNGIEFNFTGSAITSLAPGQRVLVVKDVAAFTARYGGGLPVAGTFTGQLENGGERMQLLDSVNEEIHDFDYENDWYPITDGAGFSLAIVNENADPDLWDSKTNWRPSGMENGAPGAPDPAPPVIAPILINEILTHTDPPLTDTVELFNPTGGNVNIGGWFLSDDFGTPKKFRIPDTNIVAGGYLTFDESQFNTPPDAPTSFALSSAGDEIYLFSGDGTNLTGYVQGYSFGAAANGVSFGRYTNSVITVICVTNSPTDVQCVTNPTVHFVAQTTNSLGGPNGGPLVGPVVISEIMYHPLDFADGSDDSVDEYIELRNITGAAVPLFNTNAPADTWRLRGGVDYDFPAGVTLPPNGLLLLVNFNTLEARQLAAFRLRYDVPPTVPIYGPYLGKLDNSSDDLRLERPDNPLAGDVPHIRVDRVEYEDRGSWTADADGTGASLQRLDVSAYGNDPANWVAAGPSAGQPYVPGGIPPGITTQPVDTTVLFGQTASLSVAVSGTLPFFYQWRFNGANLTGANSPVLTLPNVQDGDEGAYNVIVLNPAGIVVSASAQLDVVHLPTIAQQPVDQRVNEGSNATFSVSVNSDVPQTLRYQWRRNGVPIANATSSVLTLSNVISDVHDGMYSAVLTDDLGTVTSSDARLTVLLAPQLINPVPRLNVTAVTNGNITVGIQVRGTKPIWLQWRKFNPAGGSQGLIKSGFINVNQDFYVISNITATAGINSAGIFAIQFTNVVGGSLASSVTSHVAFLTVVLDSNGNGIPDTWESDYFGSPTGADRNADSDGDGMNNGAEYTAGTNPTNAASKLEVDNITAPGSALVTFEAVAGHTYTVEYTDDLTNAVWSKLADVTSRNTTSLVTVTDPAPQPDRYYRIVTPRRP